MSAEIAALLLAADSVAIGDHADGSTALGWAQRLIIAGGAPHCGDCTNEPHTCVTCVRESYERAADKLLHSDDDLREILELAS